MAIEQSNVKFFPADVEKNNYLGGGYLISSFLKTRFTVFRRKNSDKGFYISLPSVKKDDGWDNVVEFKNKDSHDKVCDLISPKLEHFGISSTASIPDTPTDNEPQGNTYNGGVPF